MNSITIVEQACSRCAQPRTVRVGLSSTFVCFNCRYVWSGLQPESVSEAAAPFDYRFTGTEVSRLHVYRAAVRAGFYTDW